MASLGLGLGLSSTMFNRILDAIVQPIIGTPDGPMEAVISPAVTTARSTYSATKVDSLPPAPLWFDGGNGYYWGQQCKAPSSTYPDRRFIYFSTDHSPGTGGIGVLVSVSDPTVAANWKSYDDAFDAGWLDDIQNKPAKGLPIFVGAGVAGNQYETPCVNVVNGEFLLTYQAEAVPNSRNQATLIAASPNGISDWTFVNEPLMQVPGTEVVGDGHHGYFRWGPNPFPRAKVPFDYVGYSLVGGQSRSTQGMWGSNAPKTSWTFISGLNKTAGRFTPSDRFGTNSTRWKPSFITIDVNSIRKVRQGYSAIMQVASDASGATARPGDMYEYLLADDGRTLLGVPQPVVVRGTTYDAGEVSTGSIMTFGDKSVIIYQAADANNLKVDALAVSPLRNPENTWFNYPSPAIPLTAPTVKEFNFKGASALPAGLTVASAGTTLPSPVFSESGMSVTVDGTQAIKSEWYAFEDEGFDPLAVECVEVYVEEWASTNGVSAYRRPYIGFSAAKDVRANILDGMFLSNGEGTSGLLHYHTLVAGAQPVAAGQSEDYWGVGYGTSGYGQQSSSKKNLGIRYFPRSNVAYLLGEGGAEMQEFKLSGASQTANLDKTKRLYPFFGFYGTDTAPAIERVGKMTVRVYTAPRPTDAATLGAINNAQTSSNGNSPNFAALPIGTAAANRVVGFFVHGQTNDPNFTLEATFTPTGGSAVALTFVGVERSSFNLPNCLFTSLFSAALPDGVDGTLSVRMLNTTGTAQRWGVVTMAMYGTKAAPSSWGADSGSGSNSQRRPAANKYAGGITGLAVIHSTSSSTRHSWCAEESNFDTISQEVQVGVGSNAVVNCIGMPTPGTSVTVENVNSNGAATMLASWEKS